MNIMATSLIIIKKGGGNMRNLYFEELEKVESLDAKDVGAVFGVGFLVGVICYVGYAAIT